MVVTCVVLYLCGGGARCGFYASIVAGSSMFYSRLSRKGIYFRGISRVVGGENLGDTVDVLKKNKNFENLIGVKIAESVGSFVERSGVSLETSRLSADSSVFL
jgi:hypothetical protein